jgi:hypothetical protein
MLAASFLFLFPMFLFLALLVRCDASCVRDLRVLSYLKALVIRLLSLPG